MRGRPQAMTEGQGRDRLARMKEELDEFDVWVRREQRAYAQLMLICS